MKRSNSSRRRFASSRSFSICTRLVSSFSMTFSKLLFSVLTSACARRMMSGDSPSFSEIANALDLPGAPIISR